MKKYKFYTWNDTGNQTWRGEYDVFADTDDEAIDIATTRWLENRFGIAAVSGGLCTIWGVSLKKFGQIFD